MTEHFIAVSGRCHLDGPCQKYIGVRNKGLSLVENADNAIRFSFVTQNGHKVTRLRTGVRYFPVVLTGDTVLYLHKTVLHDLSLKMSTSLLGRVFMFVRKGEVVSTECNLAGSFFTLTDIDNQHIPVWSKPTSFVLLIDADDNTSSKTIVSDCQPDCLGKSCSEEDGCGGLCGCADSKICVCGECETVVDSPICHGDVRCTGVCFGRCPDGKTCVKDMFGNHGCRDGNVRTTNTISILVWIILTFLFMAVVVQSFVSRSRIFTEVQELSAVQDLLIR
jgi:hypothetical protein